MKGIKVYLRNSIMHINLSNLSIISMEKLETKLLNLENIIDQFGNTHNNY